MVNIISSNTFHGNFNAPLNLPSRESAGFPSPSAGHEEARLEPNSYLIDKPDSTFFVKVTGDSMIGSLIFPNDVLVIDRSVKAKVGDIVLAEVDGEFTIKQLGIEKLMSSNPMYQPIAFRNCESITLIGVVTGSMRKLK